MEQKQIDELFQEKSTEEIIEVLENALDEQEEEYTLLKLGQAYLMASDEKKAKKTIRRLKMLYPSGRFFEEEDELLDAIKQGTTEVYLQRYVYKNANSDTGMLRNEDSNDEELLESDFSELNVISKGKEIEIPESIAEYFKDVAGMKRVQVELDALYKALRFQNEREEHDLRSQIFKTHFAICGARGSGKSLLADIIAHLLYDFAVRENEEPIYIGARDVLKAYEGKNGKEDKNDEDGIGALFANIQDATVVIENIEDLVFDEDCSKSTMKDIFFSLEDVLKKRGDDISMIFTGNSVAMRRMKEINPTIEDRMSFIEIPVYSTMELVEIAEKEARKKALRLHEDSIKALIQKIDAECKSPDFMNAISVNRYLEEAAKRLAYRYYEMEDTTERDMVYLMPADFEVELEEEQTMDEILADLDALVGMQAVKEQVKKRIKSASVDNMAREAGASRQGGHGSLHMLFTGNPGTGKTTVARMIGKIYRSLGILPRGNHVVECTRSEVVGQYQGHTAKLVQAKFQEAAGGVLFIDEAYALCRGDNDTFGHEAVDEIIAQMENNKDSMMVILAGYQKEMEEFLDTNPGFHSRIPESNYIHFTDYTVEEMVEIFKRMVKGKKMEIGHDTKEFLTNMIEVKSKTPNFGNARGVRNLFEEVVIALDERIYSMKALGQVVAKNQFDIITKDDIQKVAGKKLESEKTIEDLLDELGGLTGLASAKQKVREMVDTIEYQNMMKEQGITTDGGHGTLHLIFKGNAGTGKTTVARLLGKIYNKLGVLKKNVFVEVSRNDLVGAYQGQTAPKVIKKIEQADGGILFIDEAYTLVGDESDTFGKEAINTLVAELENRRDSLMVIVAGYADKMDKFLDVNQGLASRLSNEVVFEDYSEDELIEIFSYMTAQKNLSLEEGALEDVKQLIEEKRKQVKDFGNARGVRNILEDIIKKKNSRIVAALKGKNELPAKEELTTIKREDVGVTGERGEEESLEQLLEELNGLTGLSSAKEKIQEMVNRIRIQRIKQEQGVPTEDGHGTLHLIFKGNAGTGKTTVARLLGKIYTKLGVLKRNVFVEVSRGDLVEEYQGQTAKNVLRKIEAADGGILFIDEAYTLILDERDTFGKEAINTLVAELENRRNSLMVIVAGYAEEMDAFLNVNQGLASRLSHEVVFEDYSDDELADIFAHILEQRHLILEDGGMDAVKTLIADKRKNRKDFGNARGVRNLLEDIEKKKDSRLITLLDKQNACLSPEELMTIKVEDIVAMN